ncbi:MAG TPA: DUF4845 domain-containing protein [Thiotrichales bacterium]|nr:DUF4845 domain-containing protein [Thiotrichales bacterium]
MHKQKGMTLISWVVILVFILFQVVMAMKIVPVYMADTSVKSVLERLTTDIDAKGLTNKKLKTLIEKRLRINNVYEIEPEDIKITKGRGEQHITIDYEPRGNLMGNLDYIIKFHHEATVVSN